MGKKYQLIDVANELGLSTSTVSRIIAGKGNFSDETKKKVLDFIEEVGYRPNAIAQSLATSKSNNICVLIPKDAYYFGTPFFQVILAGICDKASDHDYEVMISSIPSGDVEALKRKLIRKSFDAMILTRAVENDSMIEYLKTTEMPFVLVGPTVDKAVYHVDNANYVAAKEMTANVTASSKNVAFIVGPTSIKVNIDRKKGFLDGISKNAKYSIYELKEEFSDARDIIDSIFKDKPDTIICGDDVICLQVLSYIDMKDINIPEDIRLASLFDSIALETRHIPVTAVRMDVTGLGKSAVDTVIDLIDGKKVQKEKVLGYEIKYRKSTEVRK